MANENDDQNERQSRPNLDTDDPNAEPENTEPPPTAPKSEPSLEDEDS